MVEPELLGTAPGHGHIHSALTAPVESGALALHLNAEWAVLIHLPTGYVCTYSVCMMGSVCVCVCTCMHMELCAYYGGCLPRGFLIVHRNSDGHCSKDT